VSAPVPPESRSAPVVAQDRIVARAADHGVVAAQAIDDVVAARPVQKVRRRIAVDQVAQAIAGAAGARDQDQVLDLGGQSVVAARTHGIVARTDEFEDLGAFAVDVVKVVAAAPRDPFIDDAAPAVEDVVVSPQGNQAVDAPRVAHDVGAARSADIAEDVALVADGVAVVVGDVDGIDHDRPGDDRPAVHDPVAGRPGVLVA
jgi:hypothetical protein